MSNPVDTTERFVFCFDRDHTVSVNGHPDRAAVPIGWVQYWAHETDVPVWATGNQHLRVEAEIPGIRKAEYLWVEHLKGEEYEYENSEFGNHIKPTRRDGLRLIQDLYEETFPNQTFRFVVVDDVDVSDLSVEGPWTHYFPWDFVAAVESGEAEVEQPPSDAFRNEGVPFNSTDEPDFEIQQDTMNEIKQASRILKSSDK